MTLLHVLIPLLSVGFATFHAAFARWLLRGIERGRRAVPASYETPLATILVAARNETANLPELVERLLGQSYPEDRPGTGRAVFGPIASRSRRKVRTPEGAMVGNAHRPVPAG